MWGGVSESSKPDLAVGALLLPVPLTEQGWKDVLCVCVSAGTTHTLLSQTQAGDVRCIRKKLSARSHSSLLEWGIFLILLLITPY